MITQVYQLIAITIGSVLVSTEFGFNIAVAVAFIAYALMPQS